MCSPSLYYKMPSGCPFSEGAVPTSVMNLQGERREEEKENGRRPASVFSGNEIL